MVAVRVVYVAAVPVLGAPTAIIRVGFFLLEDEPATFHLSTTRTTSTS